MDNTYTWYRTKTEKTIVQNNSQSIINYFYNVNTGDELPFQVSNSVIINNDKVELNAPQNISSVVSNDGGTSISSFYVGKYYVAKTGDYIGTVCKITKWYQPTRWLDGATCYLYGVQMVIKTENFAEIVTSNDPNAYPDSGVGSDGWTYRKLNRGIYLYISKENNNGFTKAQGLGYFGQTVTNDNTFSISGNNINWYSSDVANQLNTNGQLYHYVGVFV